VLGEEGEHGRRKKQKSTVPCVAERNAEHDERRSVGLKHALDVPFAVELVEPRFELDRLGVFKARDSSVGSHPDALVEVGPARPLDPGTGGGQDICHEGLVCMS
jgi:hypothetical protein